MHFTVGHIHPTYNQVVSVALFLLGLGIYLYQSRNARLGPTDRGSVRPASE